MQRYHYQSTVQLNYLLQAFSLAHHQGKRLPSLRGKTPHKFICQQLHLDSTIFIRDPTQLTLGRYS